MKVYTEQEVVQILNHVRNDLHEIGGVPVPTIEAMQITIDRVFDAFGIDSNNQPEDEIVQLKQRIEQLERDRVVPMPYPVYFVDPFPSYPVIPPTTAYQYKVMCSGGTITHVEKLNDNY